MSTNTTTIGDHITAHYDGVALTIEQSDEGGRLYLEPFQLMQLLRFVDDQSALRALKWESLKREAHEAVSPQWQYCAQHQCWRYMSGPAHIELAPMPLYSDRGRWAATCSGVGTLDFIDGFPMYFQDLDRAKLEMQAWLDHRMRDYDHSKINQRLDLLNRLRSLRAAMVNLDGFMQDDEAAALAQAFIALMQRVAPHGIDRD